MAETYSQIWAAVMREVARLELHLTLTISEYFADCDLSDPHQWILVRQHGQKRLHDFLIKLNRGEIPAAEFYHLANIKRQGNNHLAIWCEIYHLATRGKQE